MSQRLNARFSSPSSLLRTAGLLLLVVAAVTGCGRTKKDPNATRPVEEIYNEAHTSMTRGNWDVATRTFKQLIAQYPYGPYNEQAQIETAYAQYKSGNMDEAVSTIDRFLRTYPTNKNVPYMYYLRGLANSSRDTVFLQKVWSLDASRRDLSTPLQAYNDLNVVSERYPNSRYANDARARMTKLRNQFARHDLDAGLYYLRRDAYTAAIGRAKYLLETYPGSEYQNDAIALLADAYTHLGNKALADDAVRVLKLNDPQHPYLTGDWPNYPWNIRKLNPFAGEKSAVDNDPRRN
ncbi:outer membrane protein assembly factor BamD [Pseudoxanthomonas composti]|uniref:Outer membrane protein assembly factor BamD n=1 Tax=Pseudoxanthomonas composti TaxID=2137479 RepID=A0A4Q1JSP1_9GAMM|nr:outer membrane protein assembly factor BamD [Pseudoxanthomonas composti]RXR01445.1 outer membrane protein assembly factor BamD [Pseudoxanthomonas composti]